MSEKVKKKRINYSYINRKLTIIGDFPAITMVFILLGFFFIINGMFLSLFIICIGGSFLLRHISRKGATFVRYIKDMFSYYLSPVVHTPLPESSLDRSSFGQGKKTDTTKS